MSNEAQLKAVKTLKAICQYGLFPWGPGHFLLISLDAPSWAHKLLIAISADQDSTYQIVEGEETFVGYEFYSAEALRKALEVLRKEETTRFTTKALPQETVCSFSE